MKCEFCDFTVTVHDNPFEEETMLSHMNAAHFNFRCPLCGQRTESIASHVREYHQTAKLEPIVKAFLIGATPEVSK